jgi:hypothetical protein
MTNIPELSRPLIDGRVFAEGRREAAGTVRHDRAPGAGARSWCHAAALACIIGVGCEGELPPAPLEVRVRVTSDGSTPVPGAQLRARGEYLGSTDGLGEALLVLPGSGGAAPSLALTCPDGFTTPPGEEAPLLPVAGAASPGRALSVDLLCPPELRDAVVLVHTAGEAGRLPVKVDGVVVGQTDALGFAHVHVRAAPDTEFEVSLDTSTNERLVPPNPTRRYRLRRSDELFVLDASFDQPKAVRKRRSDSKRRAAGTPPLSP